MDYEVFTTEQSHHVEAYFCGYSFGSQAEKFRQSYSASYKKLSGEWTEFFRQDSTDEDWNDHRWLIHCVHTFLFHLTGKAYTDEIVKKILDEPGHTFLRITPGELSALLQKNMQTTLNLIIGIKDNPGKP